MEKEFQNLLRLIGEAEHALECEDSVTMIAYIKMAQAATFELPKHAANKNERDHLSAACNYSYQFCFQQTKWRYVVRFMSRFWDGVEDGFFELTWASHGNFYDLGYQFGAFGGEIKGENS